MQFICAALRYNFTTIVQRRMLGFGLCSLLTYFRILRERAAAERPAYEGRSRLSKRTLAGRKGCDFYNG